MKWITSLYRRPTPAEVAARELAEAQLAKLSAQTAAEYAQSMVQYNSQRIARLKAFLASLDAEEQACR